MSQLSTFYSPLTATSLGLGTSANVTFGSVTAGSIQNTPIGNTTPAAGSFTTLAANNGTLTASAPVLDLAQTWNNAAATFTGIRFSVTNTASLGTGINSRLFEINLDGSPIYRFQRSSSTPCLFFGASDSGIGTASTFLSIFANGGAMAQFNSGSGGIQIRSDATYAWSNSTTVSNATDLVLARDAADSLAQRRTTNPQTFNIYNTFTSTTNHERGFLKWSSNVFQIGTEKGSGGGTARALEFQTDGVTRLIVSTTGLIQIGGASSAHVALKRNSNTLQIRTADDLGFGGLLCGALTLHGNLDASTRNIVTDTTTGTKIGTATTQKIGFFNATPAVQPAAVADATDAASTQARLNDLLARLRTLGLIAT
jgi:hypothetical protein